MLYSTQNNITTRQIKTDIDKVCNRYATYPNNTKEERFLEGGLRLQGKYKQSIDTKPLITVITVVYNNVATLERCIKSILNQSYDNIEYIVIDGGSTDGTLDIIKKYSDAIDYYVSEPDEGVYYAMNKGLELASGDYISILNSDDEYYPRAIYNVCEALMNSKYDLVYGKSKYIDQYGKYHDLFFRAFDELIFWTPICAHEAMFVSIDMYNKVGLYDTKYKIAADMKFSQKIFLLNASAIGVDQYFLKHYFGGVSTVSAKLSMLERFLLLKEKFSFLSRQNVDSLVEKYVQNGVVGANDLKEVLNDKKPTILFKKMFNILDGSLIDQSKEYKKNGYCKVLQLNTFNGGGGAAIAVTRLHKALYDKVDSFIFSKKKNTDVYNHYLMKSNIMMDHPIGNCSLSIPTYFSSCYLPSFIDRDIFSGFDVINIHWISDFLSNETIAYLSHSGKPIVWTFHDKNPLTGGCHCFHGCNRWQSNCMNCPQLINNYNNLPAKVLATKKKYFNFKNITVVALSRHSKRIIEQSIYKDCRIEVIPNSIETDIFVPTNKNEAKKKLNLPLDKKIIFFLPSAKSSIKGEKELSQALSLLITKRDEYHLLVAGAGSLGFSHDKFSFTRLGVIEDNTYLALAYSSADVTVVPSLEETFSNTTAESISCGTPVVGFKTGGIPDMIIDGYTGYTVEVGNCEGLARSIEKVLDGHDLSKNCRRYAEENLSLEIQGKRYKELYEDLLSKPIEISSTTKIPEIFPETADSMLMLSSKHINDMKSTPLINGYYEFSKLSRKRKLWMIGGVISKKLKLYNILKPFANKLRLYLTRK